MKYGIDKGVGLKEGVNPSHDMITAAITQDASIATDPARFNQLLTNANKLNMKPPDPSDIRKNFDKPDVAPNPLTARPASTVTPLGGADSMEFASDDVIRQRKLAERKKKVEEDMFGKPKRRQFFSW